MHLLHHYVFMWIQKNISTTLPVILLWKFRLFHWKQNHPDKVLLLHCLKASKIKNLVFVSLLTSSGNNKLSRTWEEGTVCSITDERKYILPTASMAKLCLRWMTDQWEEWNAAFQLKMKALFFDGELMISLYCSISLENLFTALHS